MTPQSESEVIDFKPFFDMIVGILFILLIFIAAQLFFTQWDDPAQIEARERSRQIAYQWQQQATDLLQDIAARFRQSGVSAQVNAASQSISVPIAELATTNDRGAVQLDSRNGSIAKILAERLACIPAQARAIADDCLALPLLRLAGVRGDVRIPDSSSGLSLPPDRYAFLVTTLLSAELLRTAPELAAISGSGGVPAVRLTGVNLPGAVGGAPAQGDLVLNFSFEPPAR